MTTDPLLHRPAVSIVLPTFNRQKFLPAAFDAIRRQRFEDWELVVVDDGSTDDSAKLVTDFSTSVRQPVSYSRQENQGAYGARNTGVAAARGQYVAFYDSDDVWLPQHLSSCVSALDANPDVDWVYAACELYDLDTGRLLDPNSFHVNGRPRPFMQLRQDVRGQLHVILEGAVRCQILHGLYCGLQNSVLRRRVFDLLRFEAELRNEAEDQLFAIKAVAAGFRLAYIDDVHVRYHVHADNSSGSAKAASFEKRRRVYDLVIRGYERLPEEIALSPSERRALRQRVGRELFWHLGYAMCWETGHRREAIAIFKRALAIWPWAIAQWKSYLVARVRMAIHPERPAAPDARSS